MKEAKYTGLSNWKITPPLPDPFGAVAGDKTGYITHNLWIERCDEAFLKSQFMLFAHLCMQTALSSFRAETKVMRFCWDCVYSRLTVTGHDPKISYDDTNVFKLSIQPWDEDADVDDEDVQHRLWGEFTTKIKSMITDALGSAALAPAIAELAKADFVFEFGEHSIEEVEWERLPTG